MNYLLGSLYALGHCYERLGPLRPWFARHWAFLFSVAGRAAFGYFWTAFILSKLNYHVAGLPLASALIAAIAAGQYGPAILRRIQRDGKNGQPS